MSLAVTILGCGFSGGVPRPGSGWGACDPSNPKNRRRRCSILVDRTAPDDGRTQVLVDTSPDLRSARVYVSVLGSEDERERSLQGLQSSHGVLQGKIAGAMRMKRTPTLTFFYDESVDRGARISRLLDE